MKCDKVQKWLHYYAPGELTSRQLRAVDKHLQSCASCRALAEDIDRLQHSIDALRNTVPDLSEPVAFTNRVISSILYQERGFWQKRRLRLGPWITRPVVRFALGCNLLLIVVILFTQEIQICNQVSRLEQKMERPASIPKSLFAQCLSSAADFENFLFNGQADDLVDQFRSHSIQEVLLIQYAFRFRQLPLDQRIKIVMACRRFKEKHPEFYQYIKFDEKLKKDNYLKGVLP